MFRLIPKLLFLSLLILVVQAGLAATVYVDINNSGVEDGSQDRPFNTILEGLKFQPR